MVIGFVYPLGPTTMGNNPLDLPGFPLIEHSNRPLVESPSSSPDSNCPLIASRAGSQQPGIRGIGKDVLLHVQIVASSERYFEGHLPGKHLK